MKAKSVPFSQFYQYYGYKEIYGYSLDQIFDYAWSDTETGIKHNQKVGAAVDTAFDIASFALKTAIITGIVFLNIDLFQKLLDITITIINELLLIL